MRRKKLMVLTLMILILSACAAADVRNASDAPGLAASDFTLPDQDGKMVKLSDVLADYRGVVLAFYPKDDTKD